MFTTFNIGVQIKPNYFFNKKILMEEIYYEDEK